MRDDSLFGSIHGPYSTSSSALDLALIESRLIDPDSAPRIGRFILLEQVGRGGMGTVYAAFDPQLERKVALKVLHAGHSSERLMREARALAKVEDRNILTVYEVGEHQRQAYIAMELIDGEPLGALQFRERFPWQHWLELYVQAGRGLASAHRAGLVHRDFKPDNVLLARDGRVVVADFGLANEAQCPDGTDLKRSAGGARRSRPSGTRYYMAPEQLAGGPCDGRSDQYSFCLALWEAVHGEMPLSPERRSDVRAWRELELTRLATPGWLRRALHRGLHPVPEKRWPSLRELLEQLMRGAGRRRRVARSLLFAVIVVLVAGLAARLSLLSAENSRAEEEKQRSIDSRIDGELVAAATHVWDPTTAAPLLAAVRDVARAAGWRNAVINTLLQPVSLATLRGHVEELRGAAFSPRADRVATASLDDTIRVWRTDGRGKPDVLAGHAGDVHIVRFSPNGRLLASTSRDETVTVWDMVDPTASVVLVGHTGPVWYVAFTSDGSRLISSGDHGEIFVWRRDSSKTGLEFELVARLEGHERDVFHVEISLDDRRLVSAGADGTARIWSLERFEQLALLDHGKEELLRAHFSPDGAHVVTASKNGPARLWGVAGGELLYELDHDHIGVQDARFDPTGRWIATAGNDGFVTLWSVDARRKHRRWRLDGMVTAIAFSPPGDMLAAADSGGQLAVWPTDGEGGAYELTGHHGSVFQVEFSRDGRYLLSSSRDTTARVWDMARIRARAARILIDEPSHLSGVTFGAHEVALSKGKVIDLYDLHTGRRSRTLHMPRGAPRMLAFGADARTLAAIDEEGSLYLWDLAAESGAALLATDTRFAYPLPGGRWVVKHADGIALYSDAGKRLARLQGIDQEITGLTNLLGGRYVVLTLRDGRMLRLDVSQRLAQDELRPPTEIRHFSGLGCPDGRLPVWNTREAKVKIWDIPRGVATREFDLGTERPANAELDCRTGLLVVTTASRSVRVQSADEREVSSPGRRPLGHGAWQFLPDARTALLALKDPRMGLRLYEASTLRELATLEGLNAAMQVHADGDYLWAARNEHGVTQIRLPQLLASNTALKLQLEWATTACPGLENWRGVYLGDDELARLSAARCELRYGRLPKDGA